MKTKGKIVREWRLAQKLTPGKLAAAIGTSRQNIVNLEDDEVDQPRYLPRLARHMGYQSVEQLLALEPPPEKIPEARSGAEAFAQSVSLYKITVPQRPFAWGELEMMKTLPEVFGAVLIDDAMAPEIPAGWKVEFSTRETPVFGDYVMVRDSGGKLHFRRFSQAVKTAWEARPARPSSDAFITFSPADGASVVAVMMAHSVPRSARPLGPE